MSLVEWKDGGHFGMGCYSECHATVDGRTAYIWRTSPHTTVETYCWRVGKNGPIRIMSPRANLGSAKHAAGLALLRFPIKETYADREGTRP